MVRACTMGLGSDDWSCDVAGLSLSLFVTGETGLKKSGGGK